MNYRLEPSLQYTARVKVATILWNQNYVKNLLSEFCYSDYIEFESRWQKIEAIIVEKVTKLLLPKQVNERLLGFIRPIGLEIKRWKRFLYKDCHLRVALPSEFCWTSQGTIDKKRTAELMIKDERFDITIRYSLACIHCLEDDIPKLWDKIPKELRTSFYSTDDVYVLPLVEFWTYYMNKDIRKLNRRIKEEVGYRMSPDEYAFQIAVNFGFRVAAEYFLEKKEKKGSVWEVSLVTTAVDIGYDSLLRYDYYADTLCFLLSYLDAEDQIRVFESNPSQILTSLLKFPFQHFFIDTANCMWDILREDDYAFVLDGIVGKIKNGYKDFDYQNLLWEFWQKIPIDHKRHGLIQIMFYSTIRDLFEIGDEDNIRLIFQDATPEEKKWLLYHDIAQDICKNLLNGKNLLSLLKYLIRECFSSKDEVIGFKQHLEYGEIGEFQSKILHALDEVIAEFSKRKQEGGDNNKAKKVCSAEFSDMKTCLLDLMYH